MLLHTKKQNNIFLVGSSGSRKSSTGNTLTKKKIFQVCNKNSISETTQITNFNIDELKFNLFDTPGFGSLLIDDRSIDDQIIKNVSKIFSENNEINAFLLITKSNPYPIALKSDLKRLIDLFGEVVLKIMLVIIIHEEDSLQQQDDSLFYEQFEKNEGPIAILKDCKEENYSSN